MTFGLLTNSFSQNDYKKLPALGIHFFFNDFETAAELKNDGLASVVGNKNSTNTSRMAPGLAVSYMEGLNNKLDFVGTLSGSFVDYPVPDKPKAGSKFLLDATAVANLKLLSDQYLVSPYLTLGAGVSKFAGYYGAFIPTGVGIQVNFVDEAYLMLNAQYRIPVTENVAYHLNYSIGFAGNIKKKKVVELAPLPPPPVELDRDHDGILDKDDHCPDVPGIASLQGCPDKDGDGITDAIDKCPDVSGLAKYNGCPIPDTDKDGINDENDKCVDVSGVARYQGCPVPDTDGDGVNDEDDKCPNVAGPADNFGCPVIGIKSYEVVFKSGSAVLLPQGKRILDTVVLYLNKNTGVDVTVDGHTDNSGTDKINTPLSLKRANAAKAYMVSKGIAASRMTTAGFGSKQPIENNKTPAGRKKNRRIEIKIKQ